MPFRDFYTTGQISQLLHVSGTVVRKWCESGMLRHSLIPGTRRRRVTRADLNRFIQDNGLAEFFSLDGGGTVADDDNVDCK